MITRRNVKPIHEEAVLDSFKSHLNRNGKKFRLLEIPEPPDAVVEIDDAEEWIEITDAFHDDAYAKSVTSYAATNKKHVPSGGSVTNPDAYKTKMYDALRKKYTKETMKSTWQQRGQGILLLGVQSPFVICASEVVAEEQENIAIYISKFPFPIFKKIYLYVSGNPEFHVIHCE